MSVLVSRFRGSLVGAVVGDCIGAHFEMEAPEPPANVNKFIDRLLITSDPGICINSHIFARVLHRIFVIGPAEIRRQSVKLSLQLT